MRIGFGLSLSSLGSGSGGGGSILVPTTNLKGDYIFDTAYGASVTGGSMDYVADSSGSGGPNFAASGATRPTYGTSGINGRAGAIFNGSSQTLVQQSGTLASFVTTSAYTLAIVARAITARAPNATSYLNDALFADAGSYVFAGFNNTPSLIAEEFTSTANAVTVSAPSVGTPFTMIWRLSGGKLYVSVNGSAETASASITGSPTLTSACRFALNGSSVYSNVAISRFCAYNADLGGPGVSAYDSLALALRNFGATW